FPLPPAPCPLATLTRCHYPRTIDLYEKPMDLKSLIRDIPDFPKPGILFRDITTLLRDPQGLRYTVDILTEKCQETFPAIDYVVGMESRGFIFGTPLAYRLGAGFIPVRKPGKLPSEVYSVEYELEYGMDRLEVHKDAFQPGCRILIVDDLMATGGTAAATAKLVQQCSCELVGFGFIVELRDLGGRQKLPQVPIVTLVEY
ncbi:MAG TPA: adenine phosphoribosyltransferase, partial [Leptolyngbyaceae cyanobacterium]